MPIRRQSFEKELPKIVFNQPAEPKASDLTFEPYHTVDYFASQGIKISQDAAGQDKFGKQLKSFTDWLKTMKKLPATEISSHLSKSTEQKVENLAEHSVEDAEVVTESMAEVWTILKWKNRGVMKKLPAFRIWMLPASNIRKVVGLLIPAVRCTIS